MASTSQRRPRLTSDFSLGGEQAEADPLLDLAFYESADYRAIASRSDPKCFLIGRTGSGKSAALQRIEEDNPGHVVRINPEDLSLPYITDLGVVQFLSGLDVHLDAFFIALWKHVLLVELVRHRYNVDSPAAKRTFLTTLMEKVKRDNSKRAALDYLEEFGESFWCETDERVREITRRFEEQVDGELQGQLKLPGVAALEGKLGATTGMTTEVRSQHADRFQRIVNETQLPRLNKMITVLDDDILDSEHLFTYVVIDDLDRDWVDERLTNDLIRCLFRAVIDVQRIRHLKVIVALRTNIFDSLNFGSRTGGQEEKFRALALHLRWTPAELEALLDERARAAAERTSGSVVGARELLPPRTKSKGEPMDFLLARTLLRPRDAIAFFNEALRRSSGKARLTWAELQAAELPYSHKRLLALRDEWKPTYPDIDRLLHLFSRAPARMDRDDLTSLLDDACLLCADPGFGGVTWMTELSEPVWDGVGHRAWSEIYQPLVRLLFRIGFLGIGSSSTGAILFAHDDPELAERASTLEAAKRFAVHPAFRAALDIR